MNASSNGWDHAPYPPAENESTFAKRGKICQKLAKFSRLNRMDRPVLYELSLFASFGKRWWKRLPHGSFGLCWTGSLAIMMRAISEGHAVLPANPKNSKVYDIFANPLPLVFQDFSKFWLLSSVLNFLENSVTSGNYLEFPAILLFHISPTNFREE